MSPGCQLRDNYGWHIGGRILKNALLTHACVSNALSVLALKFQRFAVVYCRLLTTVVYYYIVFKSPSLRHRNR